MKVFSEIPKDLPSTPLLDSINIPEDIKKLHKNQLTTLADELREFLLYTVGKSGGHLGAGLGVVELTVALHYIFDTPKDNIVWDVGHQAYPHKIITGRKKEIETIRKKDGLAPFPRRSESEYDAFGVGHSSTSISAALGMAIGNPNKKTIAVIGDGAMTAGMAFEALSHTGHLKPNLLIILNDNDMSISENVGGLSNYFARIWASKLYKGIKKSGKSFLEKLPQTYHLVRKVETQMKGMVAPGTIFEELGLNYIGPIDGHDVNELTEVIGNLKDFDGPQFLHVITKKGAGLTPAESDRIGYHAISKISNKPQPKTNKKYQDVFGDWIVEMASQEEDLIGITPAMREGSGLVEFSKKFPDRYFDVAIAEQHAVTFAAGLACENKKPIVAIYSTFLQRAYDQFIHDVGEDGPTHSGNYDIAFMRCVPNISILTPADEDETKKLLTTAFYHKGPAAVRYPRGSGPNKKIEEGIKEVGFGKARSIHNGDSKKILLNFGSLLHNVIPIAKKYNLTLIDMRFVKPLDEEILKSLIPNAEVYLTIEDGSIMGGAGSAVQEFCALNSINTPGYLIGIPDKFIEHGSREEMIEMAGLDPESLEKIVKKYCEDASENTGN
jgi:1-deoxy-D-xylulose-5-phosphate synthase